MNRCPDENLNIQLGNFYVREQMDHNNVQIIYVFYSMFYHETAPWERPPVHNTSSTGALYDLLYYGGETARL